MKLALLVLGVMVSAVGFAQSRSVHLRGSVPLVCELSVNDHGTSVDILGGVSNHTLGSVSEACNAQQGFTVTISSQNGGVMRTATGQSVPYTISYDNSGVRALTAPVVLARNFRKNRWWTRSFRVTVPAQPSALSGEYQDLITLTIAAQ